MMSSLEFILFHKKKMKIDAVERRIRYDFYMLVMHACFHLTFVDVSLILSMFSNHISTYYIDIVSCRFATAM